MKMAETDYLVVGAGATGLAFADTLLRESDAHITIVDKHAQPGGHWNDAYPFVGLHQPSAFYGVNSLELGSRRKDTVGHNAGLYELASGPEVCGYFHKVMQQVLLPSGRVSYLPMTQCLSVEGGEARVQSMLTGAQSAIHVRRKWVDANYFAPKVPATTAPTFEVADGVRLVSPTALTQVWQQAARPQRFCILGAGKTAMDVGVWLLSSGVPADAITWVVPRDSWLINRLTTQPGEEFFIHSMGGAAQQMRALAQATSVDDLFERLEAAGQMLRIDRSVVPSMFHYATISEAEVALLRQIRRVIRRGRVQAIAAAGLVFADGHQAIEGETLYVNCTASAVEPRASVPMFQPGKIVPQLVRAPLPSFSAALCAYVEAHYEGDDAKNELCRAVPFPRNLLGYVQSTMVNMANQVRWSQDKALRSWVRDSRLDGFGKLVSTVDPSDTVKMGILSDLKQQGMAAMENAKKLLAAGR
jgi:hypothetical protein